MRKSENNMETKQHAIKIRYIKVEIKEDLKKIRLNKWKLKKKKPWKSVGHIKSSLKRKVQRGTVLTQGTRNISNKQPKLPSRVTIQRRISRAHIQQKEGNKISEDANFLKTKRKETIEKICETKRFFGKAFI